MTETVETRSPLWRWEGANGVAWFFVSIGGSAGESLSAFEALRRLELGTKRGFGQLKVEARIGASVWKTSCFPSKEEGWILPVKAAIRKAEGLVEGDEVVVRLSPV